MHWMFLRSWPVQQQTFFLSSKLVLLLQHLNIVALLKNDGVSAQYFIPCALAWGHSVYRDQGNMLWWPPSISHVWKWVLSKTSVWSVGGLLTPEQNEVRTAWSRAWNRTTSSKIKFPFSHWPIDSFWLTVLPAFLSIVLLLELQHVGFLSQVYAVRFGNVFTEG